MQVISPPQKNLRGNQADEPKEMVAVQVGDKKMTDPRKTDPVFPDLVLRTLPAVN